MDCSIALMVIVTDTSMLWLVVELEIVMRPVYVPTANPLGSIVTGTKTGSASVAVPLSVSTVSQGPPEAVVAVT